MANIKSAKKRIKVTATKTAQNRMVKSALKTTIKKFEAAVAAVEAVDTCVGKICDAVSAKGGVMLITADHGNADKMYEPDGSPFTAHTTNPVPFVVVGHDCELKEGGKLCDIAPTLLDIMGLEQPAQMTGESLIK